MKKITTLLLTCLVALVAFHARAVNTSDYVIDEGMLIGDVNVDERVNVSDVTTLINMILGFETTNQARADINGDGKVNVSDVTALINIILGVSSGGSTGGTKFKMQEWFENSAQLSYIPMHEWTDGDVIFLAIDPVSNEVCQNVYAIERVGGKWVFRDVNGSNKVGFKTSGGTFSAVYVQNANLAESYYDYIPITRDVACVDHSGTYTVTPKNGKYYITLSDLYFYHFVSRIDVSNAYEGDYFYESVTHLDALTKVSWMPTFGYGAFEKSNRAPVIDIDSNHKGHAYGVWQKGTRTDGWLTLNYAKNNGYAYYWPYGQDNLIQGRYLSVNSPWQNGWSRDLSMRYYNGDEKKSYRQNAGSTYQNVNINVGTDIIFRPYDGINSDTRGTMTSVTSSNSGILDISYDNTQVNVTAHKVGTTTLTIKFRTKDGVNCTYTYEVKVEPTVWIAGSIVVNGTSKPKIWRNWQDRSMYLSNDNYYSANKIIVHGNTAYLLMNTWNKNQYTDYYSGTAGIYKTTSAHGGGYFDSYKTGLRGIAKQYCNYGSTTSYIKAVPRMWADKDGNVYYTSAEKVANTNDIDGYINTDIYKNKTKLRTIENMLICDLVTNTSGNLFLSGFHSDYICHDGNYFSMQDVSSVLSVIDNNNNISYTTWNWTVFAQLFAKNDDVYLNAYGYYDASYQKYKNVILRHTPSSGLALYVGSVTGNGLSIGSDYSPRGNTVNYKPFILEGNKFYFYDYGYAAYFTTSPIKTYTLGASQTEYYDAYPSGTTPLYFDVKNGMIGMVLETGSDSEHKVMASGLNSYNGGTPMENSTGATIYDVFLQTSLDE